MNSPVPAGGVGVGGGEGGGRVALKHRQYSGKRKAETLPFRGGRGGVWQLLSSSLPPPPLRTCVGRVCLCSVSSASPLVECGCVCVCPYRAIAGSVSHSRLARPVSLFPPGTLTLH
ncbi:hypothetical protein E2C01_085985 [Portunus trituberculatus]|uniref:Uncharacterized protein n=1 Tax=Portunus trituberculatus TaxID=210409 RepID=A0A5B7JAC3_PORTR|nr:hypothetical protein [Portunus trituberculatus]